MKPRLWREKGVWCCAIPRDDFATRHGFRWKKYGLIGRGSTCLGAYIDWQDWVRVSNLVDEIY